MIGVLTVIEECQKWYIFVHNLTIQLMFFID